ncbi:serine/threonine-protein kinase [Mangrovihabitans endophyticus]|uniref:non-specific serine/threonine protein kinase n=1 Tax=Mangrovihabitans endophyticus TaxID=1751298 RepID=A0A8J3FQZ4_9ACTN|nr:serine/threonine-protein kinase [Mangrovihabitans endophyticus]GGL07502.1 hypothetical protein GCM10012284_47300 [Mangrovihabitans endophyticus]
MRRLGGRYELDKPVGKGGMAVVWRAHDRVLRRTVAVKVLSPELASDGASSEVVHREALSAAQLCHPHIAGVHDYGEAEQDGRQVPFLVMEFVDGPTLATRIARDGALGWREAATVCAEVADALAAAHEHGLVHRDVKPSNVMLPQSGVKVVDFGVAASTGQDAADAAGRVWGTPAYLPPEQIGHGPALPEGDVYALALLLHECLTGRPPWPAGDAVEMLAQRRRQPMPQLPDLPGLPAELVELHRRCLAESPGERPSAGEVAGILRETLAVHTAADAPALRAAAAPVSPPAAVGAPTSPAGAPVAAVAPDRRHRWRARSRRVAVVASVPAVVVLGMLAAQAIGLGSPEQAAEAGQQDPADQAGCAALYTSDRDPDGSFAAELAVTNTGADPLDNWSVDFEVPQGHTITEVSDAGWSQHERGVTLNARDELAPGATRTLSLQGTFDKDGDGVPDDFTVDGTACARAVTRVQVSGSPLPVGGNGGGASDDSSGTANQADRPARKTETTRRGSPAKTTKPADPKPSATPSEDSSPSATPSGGSGTPSPSESTTPPGDAGSGDSGSGGSGSGDSGSGGAGSGGGSGSGDSGTGDAGSGDTGTGDAGSGDTGTEGSGGGSGSGGTDAGGSGSGGSGSGGSGTGDSGDTGTDTEASGPTQPQPDAPSADASEPATTTAAPQPTTSSSSSV